MNKQAQEQEQERGLIIGRNAVTEALRAGREIDTLYILRGETNPAITRLASICRENGGIVKEADRKKLDYLCNGAKHQGVIAFAAAYNYSSVEEILTLAEERNEAPFIIVCDGLEDPHNLGAIIRTAEAVGAHGIIIPKRRSVSLNYTVAKSSAGALEHMKVARVANLVSTLNELKEKGLWIYGADMDGASYKSVDFKGATALVIGSEGKGISRLTAETCDFIVSLPMCGKINSLNASVAAGVLMYEIFSQRNG